MKNLFGNHFGLEFLLLFLFLQPAKSAEYEVSDVRPVAEAVRTIEQTFGIVITYEDASFETADVQLLYRDPMNSDNSAKMAVLNRKTISFHYTKPDANSDRPLYAFTAVRNLLLASGKSSNVFEATQIGKRIHLRPVTKAPSKYTSPDYNVLDYAVSIKKGPKTARKLIEDICEQISVGTGRSVIVGAFRSASLERHSTTISAESEPARAVLIKLLNETDGLISWRLLRDPNSSLQALNLYEFTSR